MDDFDEEDEWFQSIFSALRNGNGNGSPKKVEEWLAEFQGQMEISKSKPTSLGKLGYFIMSGLSTLRLTKKTRAPNGEAK